VRSSTAESGGNALKRTSDEAAHDRELLFGHQRQNQLLQSGFDMKEERDGFGVCRVSDDAGSRINVGRRYIARGKCCGNNAAVHTFTVGSNLIAGARSKFTNGRDATQQLVERVKFSLEFGMKLCEYACSEKLAGRVVVALAQRAREFERSFALAR